MNERSHARGTRMAKSAGLGGCVGNVGGPRGSEAAHVAGRRTSGAWGVRVVALMGRGDSGLTWSGSRAAAAAAAAHGLTDRSNVGRSVRSNVGWAEGGTVNVSNLAGRGLDTTTGTRTRRQTLSSS